MPLLKRVVPEVVASEQKRYVQNHAVRLPSGREPPFDGVVELWFNDLESFWKWNNWYVSDDAKPLLDDEENFIDKSKMIFLIGDETVITP